jgi:DNA polymerase-3 subunit alpha
LKSKEEMNLLFGETPEVLTTSGEIASRCQVEFVFGKHYLPSFEVPEGYDLEEYLRKLCWEAFPKYYPQATETEKQRLNYELEVITQTGFSSYFLIVADLCRYAREQGVAVGPGRGSAAASMVAYLLGITSVEPLQHDLLFERFLNPERISMPDIDIDFDPEGREKVIRYVTEKYGEEKVCQIITFGTMGAKAAIRDAGRALDIPLWKVDRVAKAIPSELGMTLERALKVSPELRKMIEEEEEIKRLYEISRSLEGMPRHVSTHAAGVVISKDDLTNYLPLQKTAEGFLMTQFAMKTVEEIGLLKMDFLGLRNLTIITKTLEKIKQTTGKELDIHSLPLDDVATYELLAAGKSIGVFQLESGGMRSILKDLKPSCFEDIIAVLALFRPGPMDQIPEFIRRKHGGNISYLHPKLESILKPTYGIIVYQEQVMQIAQHLAGYSLGRADLLRRAMGKKDKKIMAEEKRNFIYGLQDEKGEWVVPGALRLGINEEDAEQIFDLMAKFAEYGFNKGHATAYAMISYQTAYLKANYPLEFTASLLSSVIGTSDKVSFYIQEAKSRGIGILPPDVQYSSSDFTIEKDAIRFGLEAIRNVGSSLVEAIVEERKNGPFQSFYDFILRLEPRLINRRALESLIKAGAFSSLLNRAQGMRVLDQALELAQNRHKDRQSGQISLFDLDSNLDEGLDVPEIPEFAESEIQKMEKEYMGIYLTSHPLQSVEKALKENTSSDIISCLESEEEKKVILGGIINSFRQTITKRGEMMASFILEDLTGAIEVLVFPRIYSQVMGLENDQIVLVQGRYYINEEERKIFAEKILLLDEYLDTMKAKEQATAISEGEAFYWQDNGNFNPRKLFLKLKNPENKVILDKVLNIISIYPGNNPVYFYFQDSQQTFAAHERFFVSATSELENKLVSLIGRENVKWQ